MGGCFACSAYCSSDLVRRLFTNCCVLKFFANSINNVRTKIKDKNNLENELAKITGYINIIHASKVTKKFKIDLQITVKRSMLYTT